MLSLVYVSLFPCLVKADNPLTGFCVGGKNYYIQADKFTNLNLRVKSIKKNGEQISAFDSTVFFPNDFQSTGSQVKGNKTKLSEFLSAKIFQMTLIDSTQGIQSFFFETPSNPANILYLKKD